MGDLYAQSLLDAQRQGPVRTAAHPGWQPYCTCCATCMALAGRLRRIDREAAEDAEKEARDRYADDDYPSPGKPFGDPPSLGDEDNA